jgi:hypothetical protein
MQSVKSRMKRLLIQFPDADAQLKQLFKVLCEIEGVAGYTPASVCDSEQWSSIVNTAEDNIQIFCKALGGKNLYSALYCTYTVALPELKALLKESTSADPTPTPKPASTQKMASLNFGGGSGKTATKPPKLLKKQLQQQRLPSQTPPPRSPQDISSPHRGQQMWKPILPVSRPLHKKRRSRRKSAGHPRLY